MARMGRRRSKTGVGDGRGMTSLASGGCLSRRAVLRRGVLRHAESVGEVIDARCPETNEVATLYFFHTSEGVLPFRKKISPNAFPAPLLTLQHALVGRTHGLPRNALGVCVVFNRALDTLLMHHVSLGVIWVVTQRPPKLLGLNQKHVGCCTSVVPRVPDAAVTVLLELVVAKLKEPFV